MSESKLEEEIVKETVVNGEEEAIVEGSEEDTGEEESKEEHPVSIEELQEKLAQSEQKSEENYQKYLRVQADFDNFRRRTRKEKEDQAKYASLSLVEQLLPAMDNFERALVASQGSQDVESLAKGVEMVFRQMEQALQAEGVEVIPTVGTAFDPTVHQAVMQVDSEEYEAGTVVEELQKGYNLKDKVIRPAMVKVSS